MSTKFDETFRLLAIGKEEREKTHEKEMNIVARLMADRKQAEIYMLPELQHMQVWGWWEDQLLYQAFMLCLALVEYDAPPDWSRTMVARGKKLLEIERKQNAK
jgi:hypothetical protein